MKREMDSVQTPPGPHLASFFLRLRLIIHSYELKILQAIHKTDSGVLVLG